MLEQEPKFKPDNGLLVKTDFSDDKRFIKK